MNKINDLLNHRLKTNKKSTPKMEILAQQSSMGNLSSFAGVFSTQQLSEIEKKQLKQLLNKYENRSPADSKKNFLKLSQITCEIKAINAQAIILHGERIQQAQQILKQYQEGAFTSWLISTYGNRQTPYNFLQYYELYNSMPKSLQQTIESMPKQAIYTLASRSATTQKKQAFIEEYKGEKKQEILQRIRTQFPLEEHDKRQLDQYEIITNLLSRTLLTLTQKKCILTPRKKQRLQNLVNEIQETINDK
jgi:hypothetical protein